MSDKVIPLAEGPILRAVLCWLLRDPDGALLWFRDHKDVIPAVLEEVRGREPDTDERRVLGRFLVFCLRRIERERLIRQILMNEHTSVREFLRLVVEVEDSSSFEREIRGLELNEGFIYEIIATLRSPIEPNYGGGEFGTLEIE